MQHQQLERRPGDIRGPRLVVTAKRPWSVRAAVLALIMALPAVACGGEAGRSESVNPASAADPVTADVTCANLQRTRPVCRVIESGGRTVRYAIVRRPGADRSVLLDVGGPGAAVLGAGFPREVLGRHSDATVVMVDEPWTTSPRSEECELALRTWYRELRSTWPRGASDATVRALVEECGLFDGSHRWALAPDAYRRAVDAIETAERITIDEFWGFSFGSVRWASLGGRLPASLVSPFPVGMPAADYLAARNRATTTRLPRKVLGSTPRGRSLVIRELDLAAAELTAGYAAPRDRARLHGVDDPARLVGRLSDQLFGRYGTDSLSSALLGFWEGTCPALSDWDRAGFGAAGLMGELLRICAEAPTPRGLRVPAGPTCVATVINDAVVPAAMTRWLKRRWAWSQERVVDGPHASLLGLGRCLEGR